MKKPILVVLLINILISSLCFVYVNYSTVFIFNAVGESLPSEFIADLFKYTFLHAAQLSVIPMAFFVMGKNKGGYISAAILGMAYIAYMFSLKPLGYAVVFTVIVMMTYCAAVLAKKIALKLWAKGKHTEQ